jgi:23S rRNA pseudouridine1911/1915/1917 synthase
MPSTTDESSYTEISINPELAGLRLDQALAKLFPDYSRSRLQRWIKDGHVLVNGAVCRPKDTVFEADIIALTVVEEPEIEWRPQAIPLDLVYEDEAVLVINKPAGLVVHPGAGNVDGTLSNALLYYDPEIAKVPRAGVVHRLDKDTSGLLVVARTLTAQKHLVEQLQDRAFEREYEALTVGVMTAGGTVDAPIGRHPSNRLRMAVVPGGKEAITHYRVVERFRAHTHVRVKLETGRTHQIRVHMAHIHYPLVGDPVHGPTPGGLPHRCRVCMRPLFGRIGRRRQG